MPSDVNILQGGVAMTVSLWRSFQLTKSVATLGCERHDLNKHNVAYHSVTNRVPPTWVPAASSHVNPGNGDACPTQAVARPPTRQRDFCRACVERAPIAK